MKIGLFGGAFNPIHNGHLYLASTAKKELGLDKIVFIPCSKYAFDNKYLESTRHDRSTMVAMCMDEVNNQACLIEIDRGGVSYTIDTVLELKEQLKNHYLCLICGPDVKYTIDTWMDSDRLKKEIDIKHAGNDFPVADINIRSSIIRSLVNGKKSITGLVPGCVESWIKQRNLYV